MVPKSQLPIECIFGAVSNEPPRRAAGRNRVSVDGGVPVGQTDVPIVQNEVRVIVLQLLLILDNKQKGSAV